MLKKITGSILTIMLMTTMFLGAIGVAAPEPVYAAAYTYTLSINSIQQAGPGDRITDIVIDGQSYGTSGTITAQVDSAPTSVTVTIAGAYEPVTIQLSPVVTDGAIVTRTKPVGSGTIIKGVTYSSTLTLDHTHTWSATASGSTITTKCVGSGTCPNGYKTERKLTLSANNATYDGSSHGASTSGNYYSQAGTLGSIYYEGISGTSYSKTTNKPTNAGSYRASVSIGSATATKDFTISRANINPTVSISNWTYGGTASDPSVSGNKGSGTVTYSYSGRNSTTYGPSSTKPTNAGEYTVTASIAQTTNYNSGTATANFTISKANINPTVSISNWTYGGTASDPSVSGNKGNGNVTYSYSGRNSTTYGPSSTKPSDVGEYTVTASIAQTTNYNSGTATANFTISKANITPVVDETPQTYGDTSDPQVTGNPGSGTVTYTYYKDENCNTKTDRTNDGAESEGARPAYAGTYYVKVDVAETSNYNSGSATATYTINPRPITVASGITADDKVYDGKTAAVLHFPALTSAHGKVGTDDVGITATGRFESATVGTDKTVSIEDMKLTGAAKDNYKLAESGQQTTTKASISKLKATIQWSNTVLTYNGEEQKPVAEVTNLQTDDDGKTDTCTVKVTGAEINAGTYNATAEALEGADSGNYDMPDEKYLTQGFTINKATANMDVHMSDWVYGGAAQNPQVEGAPEDATYVVDYKPVNASSNAYTEEKPTQAGTYNIRVRVTESKNYNVTEKVNTFTIEKRVAELEWVEEVDGKIEFVFNADSQHPNGRDQCPTVRVTNLVGTDECTVTVSGASSAAGSHIATVTGLSNENYKLPKDLTHEYIIKPADINPTINMTGWEYGDEPNTPSVSGNLGGGDVSYLYKAEGSNTWTNDKPSKVGKYTVKATIAATSNYNGAEVSAEFEILRRSVVLKWSNVIFKHDGEEHIPTAVITNLKSGDECAVTVTGAQSAVGTHTATATELTGRDKDNYRITEESPRERSFVISDSDFESAVIMTGWTYEGEKNAPKYNPEVEGNPGGGEVTFTYAVKGSDDFGSYEEKVKGRAGEYTVKATIAAAGGYIETECTADFTIAKRTASLAWSGTRLTYNAETQCPAAQVSNLIGDDECTVTVTGGRKNAGEYSATAEALSNANYKLPDTVNQVFHIEKANLTITAEDKTILHGQEAPEYTAKYTGFKGSEDVSDLDGTLDFDCSYENGGKSGTYDIVPKGVSSENYNITFAKGRLTVQNNQATIETTPERKTLKYNGYEQELLTPGTAVNGVIYYSLNGSDWSTEVPKAKNVGSSYTVSWYLKPNENYVSDSSESDPAGSLKNISIERAVLTIRAKDARIQKGQPAPAFSAEYSGFVGGEDRSALNGKLEFACAYKTGDDAGEYPIRPLGHQSDNYDINYVNGKLTVWSAEAEITADPEAKELTYNGENQALVEAGTAENGTIYYRIGGGRWSDKVPTAKDAGKYSVSWYLKADSGYISSSSAAEPAGEITVEIKKKDLSITWVRLEGSEDTNFEYPYDGNSHAPFAILNGVVSGDDVTVDVSGETSAVGTHKAKATVSGDSMSNYKQPTNSSVQFKNLDKQTISYDSKGFDGVVSSKSHGITVTVNSPENAKVTYGTSKNDCTRSSSPTYSKVGVYTVYFKIEAENCDTVIGKETVRITAQTKSVAPSVLTNTSGAKFARMKPRSAKQTKNSITLNWNKVKGAETYVIYGNRCNSKGHAYYLKKISEVKGTTNKFTVKHISAMKLDKGTMHKFCIVAYNADGKIIEKSATMHIVTTGSKWKNYTAVKLSNPKKAKVVLKKGKTLPIKANAVGKNVRKHAGLRYESTNRSVASVTNKGVIRGIGKGSCTVYAYSQNGKYKAIKVTVK